MKTKICYTIFFVCLAICASAQIVAATISSQPLAITTTGSSCNYGKSTLPVCLPKSVSCSQAFTYTFTGTGNWTLPTNWEGSAIPPASLPAGATIIVDPIAGGECVLNTTQTVLDNASVIVRAGKKLRLLSQLNIQH